MEIINKEFVKGDIQLKFEAKRFSDMKPEEVESFRNGLHRQLDQKIIRLFSKEAEHPRGVEPSDSSLKSSGSQST